ncbi:Chorismate pyruvate-lyase/UbiC transcription regulator-associated domain protein [Acididesulfobacillus acetoxydans]|uniref:Chorismate pyruvate-lyase/UbiC transcription regulator-associated domain protein n=1 Tax=Acididesulfobacillus acetoxydans TaxID=1561005 RepID=A0A8S0X4C8_9FIRM|nr:UTRA domain-containing protein [Acididesulfobacillus acetoxydans]CAA7600710.1 Chorismate pyruvate-lyase/UbiC transcription regulator-associated domain protein [Acididesulfobacillus acetoxydans]CEJ09491.1 Transcription regulator HTH, GntR [Acididesulfobacillus acetoxydans]
MLPCALAILALTGLVGRSTMPELAGKLGVSAASPLLLLDQIHFDDRNLPILYSRLFFRPDYFVFHVVRKR